MCGASTRTLPSCTSTRSTQQPSFKSDKVQNWYPVKTPTASDREQAMRFYFCTDLDPTGSTMFIFTITHARSLALPDPDPKQPLITKYITKE